MQPPYEELAHGLAHPLPAGLLLPLL